MQRAVNLLDRATSAAVPCSTKNMRASDDSHFDASGPVGRYWLSNGVGFTVCGGDGRRLGVVAHVVVDRRRQDAERLIVRRRGLVRRPRYVAIDPRSVESVLPDVRLFLVPAPERRMSPATRSTAKAPVGKVAVSVRATIQALGRALRPLVRELDRALAAAAESTLQASRRGASAGAEAAVRFAARTRRDAPRLAAWLSARARETGEALLRLLRFLDASARSSARVLGDLAVLAALGAAAVWRRAAAALAQQARKPPEESAPELPGPDVSERRRDADAPLARERNGGTASPPSQRPRSRS